MVGSDRVNRLTLRVRFDGSKPQRAWLLRCEDALLSPLPEGGTHVSDFEGRHGLHHNEKEEDGGAGTCGGG